MFEIRNSTINYSKKLANERKENKTLLESELKELQGNLNTEDNIQIYNRYQKELDSTYDHVTERIKIRSKCEWYEKKSPQCSF